MAQADDYPFRIGNVDLNGFDAPAVVGDFGSEQKVALHKFTGGLITAQLLGKFPKKISFHQVLRGENARAKANEVDQLTDTEKNSKGIEVTWCGYSFLGVVENVKISPENEGEIEYEIEFQPVQRDDAQSGGTQTTLSGQNLLKGAADLAVQQSFAPVSSYQFSGSITQGTQNFQNSVNQALNTNRSNLANIPVGTIKNLRSSIGSIQQQLSPLMVSSNSQAVSAASDLNNTLNAAMVALQQTVPLQEQLNVKDPDLFDLAATYYGDPSKFYLIADANDLFDAQPTGEFQLSIPADPNVTVVEPPRLL